MWKTKAFWLQEPVTNQPAFQTSVPSSHHTSPSFPRGGLRTISSMLQEQLSSYNSSNGGINNMDFAEFERESSLSPQHCYWVLSSFPGFYPLAACQWYPPLPVMMTPNIPRQSPVFQSLGRAFHSTWAAPILHEHPINNFFWPPEDKKIKAAVYS